MSDENVPAYIGKLRCGCVISAVVDDGKCLQPVKDFLREAARYGYVIERTTVGWFREHGFQRCEEHQKVENYLQKLIDEGSNTPSFTDLDHLIQNVSTVCEVSLAVASESLKKFIDRIKLSGLVGS